MNGNAAPAQPRLSIGLPVYNGERYLAQAIDSILGQTYSDFELIISDNASTDATAEICQAYAARDGRIRCMRFDYNHGAAYNYNYVVAQARGELFKWAAHDDLLGPEFLEVCVRQLDGCPAAVLAYPKTVIIDQYGQKVRDYADNLDLRQKQPSERFEHYCEVYRVPHSCNPIFGVMRLDVLRQTPLIGSFISSDMILLGELALRGQIHESPQQLFFRRDHPQASVRAYPSYRDRIAWFDPRKRNSLQMTKWRWLHEYISAVRRANLEPEDRRRCNLLVWHWARRNIAGLSKDLLKASLWPLLQVDIRRR